MSYNSARGMTGALFLAAMANFAVFAEEKPRVWTSADGRKLTGILKDKGEDWVKLEVKGRVYTLKVEKLSKADQDYLQDLVIKKPLAVTVGLESWKDDDFDQDMKTLRVDVKNLEEGQEVYCLLVWISKLKTSGSQGIKQTVEAFYQEDGTYKYEAGFFNNPKVGEAYRGYALRIMDMDGKVLLERSSSPGDAKYLDQAFTRRKPEPKEKSPKKDTKRGGR